MTETDRSSILRWLIATGALYLLFVGAMYVTDQTQELTVMTGLFGLIMAGIIIGHWADARQQERAERFRSHVDDGGVTDVDIGSIHGMFQREETADALELLRYAPDDGRTGFYHITQQDSADAHTVVDRVIEEVGDHDGRAVSLLLSGDPEAIHRPDAAARALLACLNAGRSDAFKKEAVRYIVRLRPDPEVLPPYRPTIEGLLEEDETPVRTPTAALAGMAIAESDGALFADTAGTLEDSCDDMLDALEVLEGMDEGEDNERYAQQMLRTILDGLATASRTRPDALGPDIDVYTRCLEQDTGIQLPALRVLERLADEDAEEIVPVIPALLNTIASSEDAQVQLYALETLAKAKVRFRDQDEVRQVVDLIGPSLGTSDRRSRAAVFLLYLQAEGFPEVVGTVTDDLMDLLDTDDTKARKYAYGTLSRIAQDGPDALQDQYGRLRGLVEDGADRGAALIVLYRLFEHDHSIAQDLGEDLVPFTDAENQTYRRMAMHMLSTAVQDAPEEYRSLRPVIEDRLEGDDPETVQLACRALACIGTEETRERLRSVMAADDHDVKLAATRAFKEIGDEQLRADEQEQAEKVINISDHDGDIIVDGDKEETVEELDQSVDNSTTIEDSVLKDVDIDQE